MKRLRLLVCLAFLGTCTGIVLVRGVFADSLTPLSLLDINALPAVAVDSSDTATITWGYLGLGHMPGILAKRYNANGDPINSTSFWVNSSFGTPSLMNYDPDVAIDSANNAVIAWCSYGLASSASNIQVVYSKIPPVQPSGTGAPPVNFTAISPQQSTGEINLLSIPLTPAVAVDASDTIAIAWSYFDVSTAENGIYLVVVDASGTVSDPVKVVDNTLETVPTAGTSGALQVNQKTTESVFYYAPSIAFDGEGNIVVTWTATGLMPFLIGGVDVPLTAVYYSKYSTSGSVVSGYDKQMVGVGFNASVAAHEDKMIIAWNTLDIFSFKIRVMAQVYSTGTLASEGPIQLGVRSGYNPTAFVDGGNYLINSGIDIAADSGGNFFVVWGGSNILNNHIYLKEIYSEGGYLSSEIKVSQGFDVNYGPSIATDTEGNIIVAWNKVSVANLFTGISSIYARRYDNNLQALGDEFKVNLSY